MDLPRISILSWMSSTWADRLGVETFAARLLGHRDRADSHEGDLA